MRAVIVRQPGGFEALEIVDVERPVPIPTEVLIKVRAAGTNPVEGFMRAGKVPWAKPPLVLGWDVAGVVEDLVPGVTRFRVGDEVFGMPMFPRPVGTYAEYVAAPSRQLALKPRSLSFEAAAALPLAGLTAWQGLVDAAKVQRGQRVLVHAAGGGVGHLAVQIAKSLGAHVVATASAAKRDFVRGLGADEIIDYKTADFTKATGDIDVVFELVGGDYGTRSIQVLKKGGILLTAVERMNAELARRTEAAGRRFVGITVEPDGPALEKLGALVESGKLKVHVSEVVPFAEVGRAHALLEAGSAAGKIVLRM